MLPLLLVAKLERALKLHVSLKWHQNWMFLKACQAFLVIQSTIFFLLNRVKPKKLAHFWQVFLSRKSLVETFLNAGITYSQSSNDSLSHQLDGLFKQWKCYVKFWNCGNVPLSWMKSSAVILVILVIFNSAY